MRFNPQSRLTIIVIFFAVIGLLAFSSSSLVKNVSQNKTPAVTTSTKPAENKTSPTVKTTDGNNSVKVNIDNSQKTNQTNSSSSDNKGTCTVTKNGVTTTVPSDQVNVNENSSSDINVKVDCNSSLNSSSQTSVNNSININTNTAN